MSRAPSGVYGGVPAEERRAQRRARLLDAALDLVGASGWQAATVRAVCTRSGLTARYFYESFESREALLLALLDAFTLESAGRVLEAIAAAPDGDAVATSRAAIGAFVDLLVEDPRKAQIAFGEAEGMEALALRRREGRRAFARLTAAQARAFYGLPEDDDDRIADVTAYLLAGGLAELLPAWLEGELTATRDEIVDDCAELFAVTGRAAAEIARARSRRA